MVLVILVHVCMLFLPLATSRQAAQLTEMMRQYRSHSTNLSDMFIATVPPPLAYAGV
jgi:hypothetical protein